jgi:uncharacterized protein YcaQ
MLKTLDDLRRFTVARNFPEPTTLKRAVHRMGFVQADPIRAPARAQDLILRHRVKNYHAGDLERHYARLDIEEDTFVVYGFVTKAVHALMHPRAEEASRGKKKKRETRTTALLLEFVRRRGAVHPREVDEHFAHGRVTNYWGGSSNATTHLLELLHYRGLLRVARRENGIRIYAAREYELPDQAGQNAGAPGAALIPIGSTGAPGSAAISIGSIGSTGAASEQERLSARIDALVDVAVRLYAPLPDRSLADLVRRLRYAAPQWQTELKSALQRAKERLAHAHIEGVDWYWPETEKAAQQATEKAVSQATSNAAGQAADKAVRRATAEAPEERDVPEDRVRLLAPFDPVVRDRPRFELLWGWEYRFEAYTPAPKRKLGYYALPLLWRDRVIGWANLAMKNGELNSEFGYVTSPPRDRAFKRELAAELDRMRVFLGLGS